MCSRILVEIFDLPDPEFKLWPPTENLKNDAYLVLSHDLCGPT